LTIKCDIIVVGGGHAGCEAAAAAARLGVDTILLSADPMALGRMSCNPAIGGIAKGHLVMEIDALGGVMPEITDRTAIQYRVLNRSKGLAVWSPRAQCDRELYSSEMSRVMHAYKNVRVESGVANGIKVHEDGTFGVFLDKERRIHSKAVVLSCGTFLNGLMHYGEISTQGGRIGEAPVNGLTESLINKGFKSGRLKTGTPPRLDGRTIDYTLLERQDGDANPILFSVNSEKTHLPQIPCWITYTNPDVHKILESGLDRSPLYTGRIKGIGPRYCPSIEDKIVRFADKERHTIFVEPEGVHTDLVYPNGFSTSLPEAIQLEAIRKIPGFETVEIVTPGYAVEYDFFPPHQLRHSLETKLIPGLYFAGQINGTSGYEEAAAQGLVAGCNAALAVRKDDRTLQIERDEGYIGVLIDDLITRGTEEPYRMFTSRAEFRLKLRLDNAHSRLASKAHGLGLIDNQRFAYSVQEDERLKVVLDGLKAIRRPAKSGEKMTLYELLKRPDVKLDDLMPYLEQSVLDRINENRTTEFIRKVEAEVKYSGYLKRQAYRAADQQRNRGKVVPKDFKYYNIKGLSAEGLEKFSRIRPDNIGEASNIPGITPSDIAVLLIHLKRLDGRGTKKK